jgi:hypothetical protein
VGADGDKDGSLTRPELKTAFAAWFAAWDADKSGRLDEEKIQKGAASTFTGQMVLGPGGRQNREPPRPGPKLPRPT